MNDERAYRVYYMAPQLVEAWRKTRDKEEVITREFVANAIKAHLRTLQKELLALGLQPTTDKQAVRLDLPLSVIADLSDASEATGIPATDLLQTCLRRASKPVRKPRRKKA